MHQIYLLLLIAGSLPMTSLSADDGQWQAQPSMRYARAAHAVVCTKEAIFALAGTGTGNKPVLEVEKFDGKQWLAETTLPGNGLNAPAAAVLKDRIYLIGGFNTTTNIPSAEVLVYDISTRKWSEATPLPAPRGGHAAVEFQGKIHVLGGGNSHSTIADHSAYDPATNTWTQLAPLPRAEGSPAAAVYAGKIYAIGGRSGRSDFGDIFIYDPVSNSWGKGPAIEPRGSAGAVVYGNAIHLFGGESQAQRVCLNSVLRLDNNKGKWEAMLPMPTPRNFARAVVFNNAVYIVGGSPMADSSHASAGSRVV